MWKLVENSKAEKPLEIDETSSQTYVYVRKDFEEIPTIDANGEEVGSHWRYMEQKIKKEDWEVYKQLMSHESSLTDTEMAIVGLYEMLTGGGE